MHESIRTATTKKVFLVLFFPLFILWGRGCRLGRVALWIRVAARRRGECALWVCAHAAGALGCCFVPF